MSRVFIVTLLLQLLLYGQDITDATIASIKNADLDYFKKCNNIQEIANSKNKNGKSALMLAVWQNKKQIAEFLLQNGADINARDKDGKSALMLAVWQENLEIIKLLIKYKADTTIKEKDGLQAVDLAQLTGNGEIIDYLESLNKK